MRLFIAVDIDENLRAVVKVVSVRVYRSQLTPAGPIYTVLDETKLK